MKVIVAGSRNFHDYNLLSTKLDSILSQQKDIEIVSGTAKGTDQLGEQYAKEKGFKLSQFPADWNQHGNKAGPLRNKQMAEYSDALIAFWDGSSKGTKNMIELATKFNLKVRVNKI